MLRLTNNSESLSMLPCLEAFADFMPEMVRKELIFGYSKKVRRVRYASTDVTLPALAMKDAAEVLTADRVLLMMMFLYCTCWNPMPPSFFFTCSRRDPVFCALVAMDFCIPNFWSSFRSSKDKSSFTTTSSYEAP